MRALNHITKKEAAQIPIATVKSFLSESNKIEKVLFVCFDEENEELLLEEWKKFEK